MTSILRKLYEGSPRTVYQYFASKRRLSRARGLIDSYLQRNSVRKLHVGCGGNFMESWLNTDLIPNNDQIALMDASKPFDIPDNSFDYVYSEHFIEHLTFPEQVNFLNESFRILKSGGKIRVATPNFDFLFQLTSEDRNEFHSRYLEWNRQTYLKDLPVELSDNAHLHVYVINNYFRDWGHQFIHNKSTLAHLIGYCRFTMIEYQDVGQSPDPLLQNLERHGEMITDTFNEFETMIIEAVKSA